MQNMMKNMMGEMWQGVGNINAENWIKEIYPVTNMDPNKIGLQILNFHKSAFDNACNSMQQTQQQVEKMADPLLNNIPGIPEEWKNMLKKNQNDIKKAVDDSFTKAESYFTSTSNPVKETKSAAAETPTEKAAPKAK